MAKEEKYIEALKQELKDQLKENRCYISEDGYDVLSDLIHYYTFKNEEEFQEHIYECVGEKFIYYSDAFDYLQEQNITSFKEAFNEGFGENVCTIATYYLEEEVWDFINHYIDFDVEIELEEEE